MKRVLLIALCALVHQATLANEVTFITDVKVIEYGIYRTNVKARAPAPGTSSGEVNLTSEPRLVREASKIPALTRSSFGFRYAIEGEPNGAVVEVTDVVITPGLKDPKARRVSYREVRQDIARVGETTYMGYTFDESWEAVPGKWTFEVWHKDELLISKEFEVVPIKLQL